MKKAVTTLALSVVLIFCFATVSIAQKKNIIVLPFSKNAPAGENIDYIQQGILLMLTNKLATEPQISVISTDKIAATAKGGWEKKGLPLEEAYALGKRLMADYLVLGNIVKIGNSISVDARLLDVEAYRNAMGASVVCESVDDIIPKIAEAGKKIADHILGREVSPEIKSEKTTNASLVEKAPPSVEAPVSKLPFAPIGAEPSKTSVTMAGSTPSLAGGIEIVKPKKLEELGGQQGGIWMSEAFPTEFVAIDVGDVNGDKKNEIVIADRNSVRIFRKDGKQFAMLKTIDFSRNEYVLSIDVFDTDGDGISEIIVSSLSARYTASEIGAAHGDNVVSSFVLEYKDGKIEKRADNLPWLLRVIDTAQGPRLVGQRLALDSPFDSPVREIIYSKGGGYSEGSDLGVSKGLSVHGLALVRLDPAVPERVVAVDSNDYLCLYEKTPTHISRLDVFGGSQELVYRSQDKFGGSNSYIQYQGAARYGEPEEVRRAYLNPRIIATDSLGDKKQRIIVARNISPTGNVLQQMKMFTASKMVCFEWDGLGIAELWHTREINGYIADFQFKDADNDGEKELVLSIVKSSGSGIGDNSLIAIYKLAPLTK